MKKLRFGKLLKYYRRELGLTQTDCANRLSKKIRASKPLISQWEHGRSIPNISYVKYFAELLMIPMAEAIQAIQLDQLEAADLLDKVTVQTHRNIFNRTNKQGHKLYPYLIINPTLYREDESIALLGSITISYAIAKPWFNGEFGYVYEYNDQHWNPKKIYQDKIETEINKEVRLKNCANSYSIDSKHPEEKEKFIAEDISINSPEFISLAKELLLSELSNPSNKRCRFIHDIAFSYLVPGLTEHVKNKFPSSTFSKAIKSQFRPSYDLLVETLNEFFDSLLKTQRK
jgi:transcriptional regulator with XRE-family HTH domain